MVAALVMALILLIQRVSVNRQRVRFRLPVKRVFIDRLPFVVVFYVEDETVCILAIEALRKRPGYWHSRLWSR
jgi:hypothetical protein